MLERRLGLLLLSVGSAAVILGGAEIGLRVLGWYPPPRHPVETRRPDLYQSDPDVGYRLWPLLDTAYRYPPDRPDLIPLLSNSSGFRNAREFDEVDERPRILFIGDSFVFGEGVRAEERLTEVIEAMEPDWRVDNAGMTGFGVDLMVRTLERLVGEAQPDVVVLGFYTDDFRRLLPYYSGVGFEYPKFELDDGVLVSVPHAYPGFWERTRLFQAWLKGYWSNQRNRYDLNEALLDRFLENSVEHGFVPVTAFLPGKGDTDEDRERRAFLSTWAEARGVTHLDLTPLIDSAGVDATYIKGNWHWNPTGHRIAGEAIHAVLVREVFGG